MMLDKLLKEETVLCVGVFTESFIHSLSDKNIADLNRAIHVAYNFFALRGFKNFVFMDGRWFEAMLGTSLVDTIRRKHKDHRVTVILRDKLSADWCYDSPDKWATDYFNYSGKMSSAEYVSTLKKKMGGLLYFPSEGDYLTLEFVSEAKIQNLPLLDLKILWRTFITNRKEYLFTNFYEPEMQNTPNESKHRNVKISG